jgi:hypothetical protein
MTAPDPTQTATQPASETSVTPDTALDRVLTAYEAKPDHYYQADWANVQVDPYALRRWRDALPGASARDLDGFAADLAARVAQWSRSAGQDRDGLLQPELLARAVALEERIRSRQAPVPQAPHGLEDRP